MAAFYTDDKKAMEARSKQKLNPPGWELSINWEDNEKVVGFTLKQPTSIHGAARISRKAILGVNERRNCRDSVSCERRRLPNNPHHGNIVLSPPSLTRHEIGMLAAHLALDSDYIPPKIIG